MAAQSNLKTTPQSRTMQRGHHGLFAVFNAVDHIWQLRILHWLVKFFDIRPGRKAPPRPNDDNGCDLSICICLYNCIVQTLSHGLAQRVDRRVIDLNYSDSAGRRECHRFGHGSILCDCSAAPA